MRKNKLKLRHTSFVLAFVAILFWVSAVCAQTTSFTYQGRLSDNGSPANGNYNLQFALFDSLSGGSQIGATQAITNVAVSSGTFTVTLDFGASAFPGADRYLEITVGSTVLSPRQQITSTPYAIRALNATNEIHNATTQQPGSNFNISGNGIVGGTLLAQRYNLPLLNINSTQIVPFFGMRDATHVGLCGANNAGAILGCNLQIDLTNAPNTVTLVVEGPATLETATIGNLTVTQPASFSQGIVVNGPQQLVSNSFIAVNSLGPAGSTPLCRNGGNQIATCSSSLRYKTNVSTLLGGLDIVHRLRPISYTWKDHPERDLGLAAEEVAAVEPRLVTHNAKGEIEGVKYDRLTAVLVNAIKQQQTQIEQLQGQVQSMNRLVRRYHRRTTRRK